MSRRIEPRSFGSRKSSIVSEGGQVIVFPDPDQGTTAWPLVRDLLEYGVLDSTNDRAALDVREGNVRLPLAVGRNQIRGRGRGTNPWWSDSGSLTFTLAIDPRAHDLTVESEPKLALSTAVAVIDAVSELDLGSPALGIRWPNDLEVGGRKLGGILPERIETGRGLRLLIGVGINVLTSLADAPDEFRPWRRAWPISMLIVWARSCCPSSFGQF